MMKDIYQRTGYILDPHGAVAYLGLKKYLDNEKGKYSGIFLETAHPAKFLDVVEPIIAKKVEIPERLKFCMDKEKKTMAIPNDFTVLKDFLINF